MMRRLAHNIRSPTLFITSIISFTSFWQMSKPHKGDILEKTTSKNIKNIYVHKINSLIKISRDSLAVEEVEMLSQNKMGQKKIKKAYSEIDKTALKLEKNRQSARKARQRKNLYIKLLQNQVSCLRKQVSESQSVQISSTRYLNMIRNVEKQPTMHRQNSTVEQELDRYLSQDNLAVLNESKQKNQKKIERITEIVEQFRYWFVPEIFKGIKNLKKQERGELNKKIFKNVVMQYEKELKICRNKDQHTLRLLLPFEENNPQLKAANMMKNLNKNMQEIQLYLNKLSEISNKIIQLIRGQEINDLSLSDSIKSTIKYIANEMVSMDKTQGICGVGDKAEKLVERCLRWEQFPNASMLLTMEKIVQFDRFIASAILANEQVRDQRLQSSQIEEQREQSNMDD